MCAKPTFIWDDPFLFRDQLSEDERMIMDSARAFCGRQIDAGHT